MPAGKVLILAGLVLVVAGLLLTFGGKIPFLGRLPGDIFIQRKNFSFHFPLASCLLIPLILSLILYFFRR